MADDHMTDVHVAGDQEAERGTRNPCNLQRHVTSGHALLARSGSEAEERTLTGLQREQMEKLKTCLSSHQSECFLT